MLRHVYPWGYLYSRPFWLCWPSEQLRQNVRLSCPQQRCTETAGRMWCLGLVLTLSHLMVCRVGPNSSWNRRRRLAAAAQADWADQKWRRAVAGDCGLGGSDSLAKHALRYLPDGDVARMSAVGSPSGGQARGPGEVGEVKQISPADALPLRPPRVGVP